MATAVASLPFSLDCDDVEARNGFSCSGGPRPLSESAEDGASRSLDRVSSSDDCCVSSDCPSEEDATVLAAALSTPLATSDASDAADAALAADVDATESLASLPATVDAVRSAVEEEEIADRFFLFAPLEALQRVEVARLERTTRDEIKKARALYMRSVLATAPHRGHGPSVWPRHACLPQPRFHPLMPYTGTAPARSALRKALHADGSVCHRAEGEEAARAARAARRVAITDSVTVQAGIELPETDGELASAQWRSISMYAPVRHMVMTSLKSRYGADASDPQGWMSTVEGYAWLDEIFCAVKDAYQMLHNAEAAEWMEILEQDRLVRRPDWWGRLGFLWA